ncbi:MAG: hypothetical protein J2P28_22605 [Actinobacteria bacterium]|nr:hypothetical protein [Actinomycetota bacterium]
MSTGTLSAWTSPGGVPACWTRFQCPGCKRKSEPVQYRNKFVVVSLAAGAHSEVAGNLVACAAVKGADGIGTDLAAPLRT